MLHESQHIDKCQNKAYMCLEATLLWEKSLRQRHSYYCHKLRFLSLSHTWRGHLRKTAQIWRNALALSPVIYVWHLGRVCSMTWHKYLHVKFFLAQVMPLTSVCHSLPSSFSFSQSLPTHVYCPPLDSKKSFILLWLWLQLCSRPAPSPLPSRHHRQAIIIISFWGYHGDIEN